MVRRAWRIIPVAIILWLSAARQVSARPAHKRALADYFGPMLPKKLNDCRTCHLPDPPGTTADQLASEKPHNPFGARLKAIKSEMRKAGKGIIGMKILGQGDLRNRQDEALKYALSLGVLDAFTIGAESKREQEDLIRRVAAA